MTAMIHEMIHVQGGWFHMGDADHPLLKNARPVHRVTVSSFFIAPFQVSQGEWAEVFERRSGLVRPGGREVNPGDQLNDVPDLPVTMVSWLEAVSFCNLLSKKEGLPPCYMIGGDGGGLATCDFSATGYRLPTEAEWEYAARGGRLTGGFTYAGSNALDDVGWFKGNSSGCTHKRELKKPNELGVFDMSGNVWEWCWDRYGSYTSKDTADSRGPDEGDLRVYRGGSWIDFDYACRVASRGSRPVDRGYHDIGFRVVRSAV